MISRRKAIGLIGGGALSSLAFAPFNIIKGKPKFDLTEAREKINLHFEGLAIPGKAYGAYRTGTEDSIDMYSSCDIAIARHIMGENLVNSIGNDKRNQWIEYINSFQNQEDGSYSDRYNHSKLHGNGMSIGALGVLNGKQRYPVKLYNDFNTIDKVGPWLENTNWSRQWSASHLFWGGIHCYSLSKECDQQWLDFVFNWLNSNLDPNTGWWRKGTQYKDRHQPLGGSVHILPIYQHHDRVFPYPESVINSVIELQLPDGRWLGRHKDQLEKMHYLELDALYAYKYMMELAPNYRKDDIYRSVEKYVALVNDYWNSGNTDWKKLHPHRILSIVGTFGLLQSLLPDQFIGSSQWTDIFSDIQLYNTKNVEAG